MPNLTHLATLLTVFLTASASFAGALSVPIGEILPQELIESDLYTLAPEAVVVDAVATFTVTSAYGNHDVTGRISLEEHIIELEAIGKLDAMKKTGVYKDALKNSALGPWNTAKGLVKEPVTTVKESVKGFGGFLADVGYSVFSKNPNQENVAKTTLGFATAKRQLAYDLGVNPYTRFEPLQDALGEVAWTATGGGLTVTVLMSGLDSTAGSLLRVSKTAGSARKLVRDMSPRKLANYNEELLLAMGINETSVELLLENYNYDAESLTRIVAALDGLKDAEGFQSLVDTAIIVTSFQEAQSVRDWIELIEAFSDNVSPVTKIVFFDSIPYVVDNKKTVHGVFPADYVAASDKAEAELAGLAKLIEAEGYSQGQIVTTGVVESEMEATILAAGWEKVTTRAQEKL